MLAFAVLLTLLPSALAAINKIVMFGDSLSDTGVAQSLTKDNGPVIPSDAYYNGRFSNGPIWIDFLASNRHLTVTNFAVGAATTSDKILQGWLGGKFGEPLRSDGSTQKVPGVDTQVANYLKKQDASKSKILYTIYIGPNDYFDDAILGLGNNASYYAAGQRESWCKLVAAGAKNILVLTLSPLNSFYSLYTSTIVSMVSDFKKVNPSVKITTYEIPLAVWDAASNGFAHDSSEQCCTDCFSGLPPAGNATVCSDPNSYLIWDGLHPSSADHKIMGSYIESFINTTYKF